MVDVLLSAWYAKRGGSILASPNRRFGYEEPTVRVAGIHASGGTIYDTVGGEDVLWDVSVFIGEAVRVITVAERL